jgi:hypothetical protein
MRASILSLMYDSICKTLSQISEYIISVTVVLTVFMKPMFLVGL